MKVILSIKNAQAENLAFTQAQSLIAECASEIQAVHFTINRDLTLEINNNAEPERLIKWGINVAWAIEVNITLKPSVTKEFFRAKLIQALNNKVDIELLSFDDTLQNSATVSNTNQVNNNAPNNITSNATTNMFTQFANLNISIWMRDLQRSADNYARHFEDYLGFANLVKRGFFNEALRFACRKGNETLVKLLLKHESPNSYILDFRQPGTDGCDAYMLAKNAKKQALIDYLEKEVLQIAFQNDM